MMTNPALIIAAALVAAPAHPQSDGFEARCAESGSAIIKTTSRLKGTSMDGVPNVRPAPKVAFEVRCGKDANADWFLMLRIRDEEAMSAAFGNEDWSQFGSYVAINRTHAQPNSRVVEYEMIDGDGGNPVLGRYGTLRLMIDLDVLKGGPGRAEVLKNGTDVYSCSR
jgi:hypothetical protein